MVYTEKKLPIVFDAAIISECWTFAKLAIIQTTEHAESWLASHLSLYVDILNLNDLNVQSLPPYSKT